MSDDSASPSFLELFTGIADELGEDREGIAGGFVIVLDWLERRCLENPTFFSRFRTIDDLRHYLRRSLQNQSSRAARRWARERPIEPLLAEALFTGDEASPVEQAADQEFVELASDAIARLPSKERAVVRCVLLEERSMRGAAEILGLSKSTVSRLYGQAIYKLSQELANCNF